MKMFSHLKLTIMVWFAPSAGAVEYTDSNSAEG